VLANCSSSSSGGGGGGGIAGALQQSHTGYSYCPDCCWGGWPAAQPDVITLHIGTNDVGDCLLGKGPFAGTKNVTACAAYLEAQLDRLLSFAFGAAPRARLFLATVLAMPQYAFYNETVARFNGEVVPALAAKWAARGFALTLVDVHAATGICTLAGGDCCGDLVHPTGGIGYPRMAQAWFSALNASGLW